MGTEYFADIILPLPLPRLFTYSIPEEFAESIYVGSRVIVPFGKKKYYSGIIYSLHNKKPEEYETKEIFQILDPTPIVNEIQLKFWEWIAEYYLCTIGEVYKAALPSGLKLESKTKVHYNTDFVADEVLNEKENIVLDFLQSNSYSTINDINKLIKLKDSSRIIQSLLDKNAIFVSEKINDGFKPKTKKVIFLSDDYKSENKLQNLFTDLSRAKKQLSVLMTYLTIIGGVNIKNFDKIIDKSELKEKSNDTGAAIKELINKGVFIESEEVISRLNRNNVEQYNVSKLNSIQQNTFETIKNLFVNKNTVLLHGVTSSGKTEIYIHLIQEYLNKGQKVLYLLPEIALTTQITSRLLRIFGDKLGVYHSKYSDAERVETWNDLLSNNNYEVIIGVRSSIFLPFENLGLIIIDEEHENSFKQYAPAPRYNGRDAAIMLAYMHGAKVLLGTATPSLESYYNVQIGKYGLVELTERYKGIKMPNIITVNIKEEKRKKKMEGYLSPTLIKYINNALNNGEQAILFKNRRGFSPYVECATCNWVANCSHCDVTMTYHKHINRLICHYCGYAYDLPQTCSVCNSPTLQTKGFGTEQIEEDVKIIFPDANVKRMDLDTSRTRKSHEEVIGKFERGEIDILIGTQMISKGMDFDKVSVVGILDADAMLNFPDFRAYERSFQLMAQVSGRAGRKNKQGNVIIQTSNPDNPIIANVINNNYKNLYESQTEERMLYNYPPYFKMIFFTIKHRNNKTCEQAAEYFSQYLRGIFEHRVVGPQKPLIGRIQNLYLQKTMLKLENNLALTKVKNIIREAINTVLSHPGFKAVIIQADVDPQ